MFLEYAWDMRWCDPCAADPLSPEELRQLGVSGFGRPAAGGAQDVFLTRLHVRYDAAHFPEDLVFQETGDRENFQGRYVLRHPWRGNATCEAGGRLPQGRWPRARSRKPSNLANLTGWPLDDIRRKMGGLKIAADRRSTRPQPAWYERLWRALARP